MVNVGGEQCEVYGTAPAMADVGGAPLGQGKAQCSVSSVFFPLVSPTTSTGLYQDSVYHNRASKSLKPSSSSQKVSDCKVAAKTSVHGDISIKDA